MVTGTTGFTNEQQAVIAAESVRDSHHAGNNTHWGRAPHSIGELGERNFRRSC